MALKKFKISYCYFITLLFLFFAGPNGCSNTLPEGAGLEGIKKRGVLRIATLNSSIDYFIYRGEAMGFQHDLAIEFARDLDVKLEIIAPKSWKKMVKALRKGEVDLIAASITITPKRKKEVLFSDPYVQTDLRPVWAKGSTPILSINDLSEKTIHVRRRSNEVRLLRKFDKEFRWNKMIPIRFRLEPAYKDPEIILEDISKGNILYTVCDHHIALINKTYLPNLEIGPPISDPQELAWAVHPKAHHLIDEVNIFFKKIKKKSTFKIIYHRYYKTPHTHAQRKTDTLFAGKTGKISPYDDLIKMVAKQYQFDWRLLAAQIYQESRFNPRAKSWAGARGLYQIMPNTAKELGIKNPYSPSQSIKGGAKYLHNMYKKFRDVPLEEDRLKLALASYNCGFSHILDAQRLAQEHKELDPLLWEDIATALRLLSTPKYKKYSKAGYLRTSEPIHYVDQIWSFYTSYQHALGEPNP